MNGFPAEVTGTSRPEGNRSTGSNKPYYVQYSTEEMLILNRDDQVAQTIFYRLSLRQPFAQTARDERFK
jgi:hypothetical protein